MNRIPMLTLTALVLLSSRDVGLAETPGAFRVWATSCAHVPAGIRRGRESLAKVIRQSEGLEEDAPTFQWDIMIDAGDLSAHQPPPGDPDGRELIRQYRAMTKHRREQVYNVPGNHDAPYYDQGRGSPPESAGAFHRGAYVYFYPGAYGSVGVISLDDNLAYRYSNRFLTVGYDMRGKTVKAGEELVYRLLVVASGSRSS